MRRQLTTNDLASLQSARHPRLHRGAGLLVGFGYRRRHRLAVGNQGCFRRPPAGTRRRDVRAPAGITSDYTDFRCLCVLGYIAGSFRTQARELDFVLFEPGEHGRGEPNSLLCAGEQYPGRDGAPARDTTIHGGPSTARLVGTQMHQSAERLRVQRGGKNINFKVGHVANTGCGHGNAVAIAVSTTDGYYLPVSRNGGDFGCRSQMRSDAKTIEQRFRETAASKLISSYPLTDWLRLRAYRGGVAGPERRSSKEPYSEPTGTTRSCMAAVVTVRPKILSSRYSRPQVRRESNSGANDCHRLRCKFSCLGSRPINLTARRLLSRGLARSFDS